MFLRWLRFHPITCVCIAATAVALTLANFWLHLYFGGGSTTVLRYGHGWPAYFQGGPVRNTGGGPNYIWGHPEENDIPETMAEYRSKLPSTPWAMLKRGDGYIYVLPAIFDVLIAVATLSIVTLVSETTLRDYFGRQGNYYGLAVLSSLAGIVTLFASVYVAGAWCYFCVALFAYVASVLISTVILSHGYE